jgi:hypothetical protein
MMSRRTAELAVPSVSYPIHGWIGLLLILVFWPLNWFLPGVRTNWGFFPLWLGYALTVDALAFLQNCTSLLYRNWKRYIVLFLISAPGWWLFELINRRVQNWHYLGMEHFTGLQYFLFASLSFSTVIPAVFGAAEWVSGFDFIKRQRPWIKVAPGRRATIFFFAAGLAMLTLMLVWPHIFFPFIWLSVYFIIEPINVWLGNHSIIDYTRHGDWRPITSLFIGVLITGFFWELWNYYSFPKWYYTVPGVNFWHVFEMPLLGYLGYLPFSLELLALYNFMMGLFGQKRVDYIHFES